MWLVTIKIKIQFLYFSFDFVNIEFWHSKLNTSTLSPSPEGLEAQLVAWLHQLEPDILSMNYLINCNKQDFGHAACRWNAACGKGFLF